MGQPRKLSNEDVRDIYLSPASASEMAEEYRVGRGVVRQVRRRVTYRAATEGLPKPPYVERRPSSYRVVPTEPLRRKHLRIPSFSSVNSGAAQAVNEVLSEALESCSFRQQQVFQMRTKGNMTLEAVAKATKCTRERVRQIEIKLFTNLGWYIALHLPENEYGFIQRWLDAAREARSPTRTTSPSWEVPKPKPQPEPEPEPEAEPVRQRRKDPYLPDYMYDEDLDEFKNFVVDELARGDRFPVHGAPQPPSPPRPPLPPEYGTIEERIAADLRCLGLDTIEASVRLRRWLEEVFGKATGT